MFAWTSSPPVIITSGDRYLGDLCHVSILPPFPVSTTAALLWPLCSSSSTSSSSSSSSSSSFLPLQPSGQCQGQGPARHKATRAGQQGPDQQVHGATVLPSILVDPGDATGSPRMGVLLAVHGHDQEQSVYGACRRDRVGKDNSGVCPHMR